MQYIADFAIYSKKSLFLLKISNILPKMTNEIAQSIKFRREFLSLRQQDLAELSGIAIKTIHLVESGAGNPSIDTLEKIARVLGMELLLQVKKIN